MQQRLHLLNHASFLHPILFVHSVTTLQGFATNGLVAASVLHAANPKLGTMQARPVNALRTP
jgi:hypothetical protein